MAFWRSVDWQRPWLAPYRAQGEAASKQLEAGDSVADARQLDCDLEAGPPQFHVVHAPSYRAGA